MGRKLYPPYIEGTLPAFFSNGSGGIDLYVPYSMNKAVSENEFKGFAIKIKSVQSNDFLLSGATFTIINNQAVFHFESNAVESKLSLGSFYKIQLAYISNDIDETIGYYSTVGVAKYTCQPTLTILGLDKNSTHRVSYTGIYSQYGKDSSEKEYSYCFNLYEKHSDEENFNSSYDLISSSGWLLHNSSADINSYESQDTYSFQISLRPNLEYKVEYQVQTINNVKVSPVSYIVMEKTGIKPELNATLKYSINFNNGYIKLFLVPHENNNSSNGAFLVSRACEDDNYNIWHELNRFTLRETDDLSSWSLIDFTVEQGKKYIYAIQQYNTAGLYSSKLKAVGENTNSIYAIADFEDAFLYDGKRQLKIRFNPKISSFKTDKVESKIDTIGSKYPFFFRNGNIEYKEFSISGLISYWSDEENLFIDDEKLGLTQEISTLERNSFENILTQTTEFKPYTVLQESYNFSAERLFKMEVLNWLNDGQVKLFRSPQEGNFLVRLMNVTLTPEDSLSRLLHSFSATAYEVADNSYTSLGKYGIVNIIEPSEIQYRIMTFDCSNLEDKEFFINSGIDRADIDNEKSNLALKIQELEQKSDEESDLLFQKSKQLNDKLLDGSIISSEDYFEQQKLLNLEYENSIKPLITKINLLKEKYFTLGKENFGRKINRFPAYEYIRFRDILPGTQFEIYDETVDEYISITILRTGDYTLDMTGENHIYSAIYPVGDLPITGFIDYKYIASAKNIFEKVSDIEIEEVYPRTFIGPLTIIDKTAMSDEINNIKHNLINFQYSKFYAKQSMIDGKYNNYYPIFYQGNKYYHYDEKKGTIGSQINPETFSEVEIYKVYENFPLSYSYCQWACVPLGLNSNLYQFKMKKLESDLDYTINIDGEIFQIKTHEEEEIFNDLFNKYKKDKDFNYIKIGNGIVFDCAYIYSNTIYNVELTNPFLSDSLEHYHTLEEQYQNILNDFNQNHEQAEKFLQQTLEPAWANYCSQLRNALMEDN